MRIASVLENKKIEKRIAITPEIAKKYISLGFELTLSENYGDHLGILDNEYKKLGVNGTDYLGVRNEDFSISSFELFDVDLEQDILSAGFSYYFNKKTQNYLISNFGLFDLIYSANTIGHIDNIRNTLKLIYDLLNNKGYFIFENILYYKKITNTKNQTCSKKYF